MDIPEDITIVSCNEVFAWIGDVGDMRNLRFDFTKIILQDSSGAYYQSRTNQQTMDTEKVILTNLKMHPIPDDHIYPIYRENLLRAPDSILSNCYIKRPALSTYEDGDDAHEFKNYMMAEIEICEILKKNPHPNVTEYLGCLIMGDGTIHGICLTLYEITLLDLVIQHPLSVDVQGCLDGIRKGIEHLHSLNLIHNDINPANIMMNKGEPVIIDFDSCVEEGHEEEEGRKVRKRGSMGWSPPDRPKADKQNDYYGLRQIEKWLIQKCQKFETDK